MIRSGGRVRALVLAVLVVASAGCSLTGGTLGGRDKCWTDQRAASVWRGILQINEFGGNLATPEGDVIPLLPGTLTTRINGSGVGELTRGDEVVATAGQDVDLFGGAGSDGGLVVCAVEEIH